MQWKWFVPQDPDGLRRLFPDNATYLADLEEFLNKARGGWGRGCGRGGRDDGDDACFLYFFAKHRIII